MTDGPARHSRRAGPALRALAESDPALAALSLWCLHRDGAATKTQGKQISYGPDFDALPLHEQIGLAAHHILHVALRHPGRMAAMQARLGPDFDPALYNLAADAMINDALLLADHALPRPAVRLVELLTERLGIDQTPEEAVADWDVDRLYLALAAGHGGRGADGETGQTGDPAKTAGFSPDLDPEPGGTGDQDGQDSARWRQHLTRAMDAGQQAGRGIGRIGHRIADIPAPRVPWEHVLRRLVTNATLQSPEQTSHRPSRRWIAATAQAQRSGSPLPGFQPAMRPLTETARIVLAIDASSSVDDLRLGLFWAEVSGIARRMAAELHLLVFDDIIQHRACLDPTASRLDLPDLPRGGGTAFPPVIQAAEDLDAAILVVFTDLEGDVGPPPRKLPVIWAVPDPAIPQPAFGHLLDISS